MKASDIPPLVAYVGELWPHYRAPGSEEAYDLRVHAWLDVLGDLDPQAVRAGIASLAQREFAPSPGQIRASVVGLAESGLPTWDEFWFWVRGVASRASLFVLDDGPRLVCPWRDLDGLVTVEDLMDGDVAVDDADLTNVRQAHLRRRFVARVERAASTEYGQVPAVAAYRTGLRRLMPGEMHSGLESR